MEFVVAILEQLFGKGPAEATQIIPATVDKITIYVSHSVWESRESFQDWTRSESFRKSHAHAQSPGGTLEGHPKFEGYEIVI